MKIVYVSPRSFTSTELKHTQDRLAPFVPPGVTVKFLDIKGPPSPPDFKSPTLVPDCWDLRGSTFSAPLMVARAEEAEREGYDAVVMCCVWDPGLWAAKAAVRIPVIGETETMFRVASLLGDRWGVITGVSVMKSIVQKNIQCYGVADHVLSLKTIELDPIREFAKKPGELEARLIERAKEQISEGADLIIGDCGAFLPNLGIEGIKRVKENLGVPFLEPMTTALGMAQMLVNLGLSQSKIAYPLADRDLVSVDDLEWK